MATDTRPLSIIQVGSGFWGRTWAEVAQRAPGCSLAAVVDGAAAARQWAAAALGVPTFATLPAALGEVSAEAVLVVSPPASHRSLTEEALDAGLHVVCEKPLALDVEDAEAIAAAAAQARLHVVVSQNYRLRRQPKALQQLISDGVLGRLLGIRIACRRDLRDSFISRGDWRASMAHPYLVDMAIHHIDLLRMVTGLEVTQAVATAWRVPDSPFLSEPNVEAILTLSDGTPVAYEGTFAAVGRETSWNGDWEIVGTRARATWTGGVGNPLRGNVVLDEYGSPPHRVELPRLPALDRLGILRALRQAVRHGVTPESTAADNVQSMRAVLALARSIDEGAPVAP